MLILFKKDKDYGAGMEFKPISRLDLPASAERILRERGHVRVIPQSEIGDITPLEYAAGDTVMPVKPPIEYRAVYQNETLAGAYIAD